MHICLFLEELLEPVGGALGVPLQSITVVHEVYPEPDRVAIHPLEIVQQRPREVAFHIRPVAAANHRSDAASSPFSIS